MYELKRGEYTVSEKLMTGFEIQDVPVVDNVTNCFVSGPANDLVTFEMGYAGAVSYTHLDVYKRQVLELIKIIDGALDETAQASAEEENKDI